MSKEDPIMNLTSPTARVCALQGISHINKNVKIFKLEVLIIYIVI